MKVAWQRAIRFVASDGRIIRGEPLLPQSDYILGSESEPVDLKARVIVGQDLFDESGSTHVSDEVVTVKRLLSPIAAEEVPILRCVGLNYVKHSKSQKLSWQNRNTDDHQSGRSPVVLHRPFPRSSSNQTLPSTIQKVKLLSQSCVRTTKPTMKAK
jgi:hypothetical protein